MKILCIGAGAIGSYIGGSLQMAGNDVVFIERPSLISDLKKNGIWIESIDGKRHHVTDFHVFGNAEEALKNGAFDFALIAIKSFDTESLILSLQKLKEIFPPVLCLQNGVENEEKLAAFLGEKRVIPVSVCTAISRGKQNSIKVEKLRGIGIGSSFPLSKRIAAEFKRANLKPKLIEDTKGMKWSKMISNLLANASSAILNMTPAEIFTDSISYKLEIRQLRETLDVMRAYGIQPVDIPGVPIRLLCFAVRHLPTWIVKPLLKKAVGSGRGGKMPSFYIDLYAGKQQSEVEFLNGAVCRYAKQKGIPVPVNELYYRTLMDMAGGRLDKAAFDHAPARLAEGIS